MIGEVELGTEMQQKNDYQKSLPWISLDSQVTMSPSNLVSIIFNSSDVIIRWLWQVSTVRMRPFMRHAAVRICWHVKLNLSIS